MTQQVDARLTTVVSAIKQSLQQAAGPGSSVNSHPNPFFINVQGAIDLKHMAELVLQRVDEYAEALAAKASKEAKAFADALRANPEGTRS